jgi:beta-lactamase class A
VALQRKLEALARAAMDVFGSGNDFFVNEPDALARAGEGRLGVCIQDRAGASCIHGDERFSLQSVMKLIVAVAAIDRVDRDGWRLYEPVLIRRPLIPEFFALPPGLMGV